MEDPTTSLTSESLLVLYNQLNMEQQIAFNHSLATDIRLSQLHHLGCHVWASQVLSSDSWFETELRAITQDCVLKYNNRLMTVFKRAKQMALVEIHPVKSVYIKCHDEIDEQDNKHWQPFDADELAKFGASIVRWYVSRLPGTDYEGIVVSE